MTMRMRLALVLAPIITATATAGQPPAPFKAGVAARVITPAEPLWMAGYGSRTKPAA